MRLYIFQNDQPCLPGLSYTGEQLALASSSINLLVASVSFARDNDLPREATTNPVVVILQSLASQASFTPLKWIYDVKRNRDWGEISWLTLAW